MSELAVPVADGVRYVDTVYTRPDMMCAYLVGDGGEHAVFDPGSAEGPDRITEWFDSSGIDRGALRYCFVSHAHLDHCAGTAAILERFPEATAVVHESAHPHIEDPFDKLWGSAVGLYGEEFCKRHYGCTAKVDPSRLRIAADGERFGLGARSLEVIHTPGHAWHHMSLHDPASSTVFSGDGFGVSYRDFDRDGRKVMFPTAPPPQFNPEEMKRSVRKILERKPERVGLAHFSTVDNPEERGKALEESLDLSIALAREIDAEHSGEEREKRFFDGLIDLYVRLARETRGEIDEERSRGMFRVDALLNSRGILRWIDREREKQAGGNVG